MCHDYGVVPPSFFTDNRSAFTSHSFQAHLVAAYSPIIQFAGVEAHNQNGHTKYAIQTIMAIAQTMMLHATIHQPDIADPQLWPMAVHHDVIWLQNHILNPGGTNWSPYNIFT
jgi:hypothetical protein